MMKMLSDHTLAAHQIVILKVDTYQFSDSGKLNMFANSKGFQTECSYNFKEAEYCPFDSDI